MHGYSFENKLSTKKKKKSKNLKYSHSIEIVLSMDMYCCSDYFLLINLEGYFGMPLVQVIYKFECGKRSTKTEQTISIGIHARANKNFFKKYK